MLITYPSVYVSSTGFTAAVVELITSTSGLTRWVDYIPVQFVTADDTTVNTHNSNGALMVEQLLSTTNKVAGVDFIKVYEDLTTTKAWSTDTDGYIPIYKHQDWTEANLHLENGFNVLQEDGYLMKLEN